jgi:hypothetical protein
MKPVRFKADRWRAKLPDEPELGGLLERYPSGIGRSQLHDLSEQARSENSEAAYCRLFFAAMLWGFGRRGYGPTRVKWMRTGKKPVTDALLRQAAELVGSGDPAEALRRLDATWLGVSFGTKYLYVVGLAYELRPRPLVLDLNVERALRKLAVAEDFDAAQFARAHNREIIRSGSAYYRYTELLAAWGEAIGCPADHVEYFLFKRGGHRHWSPRAHS